MALRLFVDHNWISPYAFSSWVALREKGLSFEVVEVNLQQKRQKEPAFRDGSLTGRVPALEHDGFWLAESSAIAEYLEDVFPPPHRPAILPRDLRERARARQLMAWIRSDLMPIREERATHTIFYAPSKEPLSAAGKDAAEKLIRVAERLVREGATTLFGSWCIADADLGLVLQRLAKSGDPMPAHVKAYADAQWERPIIKEWVDHARPTPYVPY